MGLRDDIEAMERHSQNGTLKEWFEGTAEPIPEPYPTDPTANSAGMGTYRLITLRGD